MSTFSSRCLDIGDDDRSNLVADILSEALTFAEQMESFYAELDEEMFEESGHLRDQELNESDRKSPSSTRPRQ
jgi:hypothetical protein